MAMKIQQCVSALEMRNLEAAHLKETINLWELPGRSAECYCELAAGTSGTDIAAVATNALRGPLKLMRQRCAGDPDANCSKAMSFRTRSGNEFVLMRL